MKILLDIDDTALITTDNGKTWIEHPRLKELLNKHTVILYSANPDIENYYSKWDTKGFFPKGTHAVPKGDVLIDDQADLFRDLCDVKEHFYSIDEVRYE